MSVDGGEWVDVPNGEFIVEGSDVESGWELEHVNIADAVKDGSTYCVALTTVSAGGYATSIDNILIYNKEKFVGIDTPKPVTDLVLSYADNTASLSWTAPTIGLNDVTDLHLTYEVVRIVNGVETIVAEAQEATEFSEEYVPDSFEALSYRVTPINEGTARGESTTSNVVKVGAYTLPIAESFAGGVLGDTWTATAVTGSYNWTAASASSNLPKPTPQDEDGGLLYYNSYSSNTNNSARLESAPIKVSAYPTIEFYLYQYSSNPKDYVKVQVSKDGGAWEDVEEGSFYVETTPEGWALKTVSLAAAVRGASTYRVALTAVSGYGFNIVIDNIRVYEAEPYQGIDTPLPVTDVVASNSGSQVTVNWTAPKKGVNGVLELNLTYEVVRIVNGEETVVAEAQEGTQFTEEYSSEDFVQICYRVTPINEGQERGESTTSNYIKMGVMSLPFADSFAGGELSAKWDAEILSGSFCWTAAAVSNKTPIATPQDGDGGLAFYQSYSANRGSGSRLYTAPIYAASSTNPVLSFYMYHYSSSDALKIQVSKDGGEWEDVEDATFTLSDGASDQWVEHQVYLASAIEGATTYRVGITSISDYGKNTCIDNVKIYNVEMYNLQAVSAAGPTNVVAGNGADYVFTVLNKGGKTVAADDYSLEITVNGVAADMESVEIGAGKSAQFTLHLDYDATQIGSDVEIAGKVVYAADENADDNAFETITIAVSALDQPTVNNLDGNFDGECVNLSWTSPIDLSEYQPISISESFEDLESDTQWPYNGFTVADGNKTDHAPSSGYFGFKEPTFTLYVASLSYGFGSPSSPQDGSKMLGVTCASGVQQDDWLISPELNCHKAATMTLSFWMQTKSGQYTGTGCDVVYSTTDSNLASFTNIAKTIPNNTATNGEWVNVVVSGIPATAKYIAIHFNGTYESSYSTYSMTLIDNVSITDQLSEVLGYNVYESSLGRVNDEMLPADATSFSYEVPTDQSADMDDEDEADVDQILRAKRKAETDTYYHFYVSTVYDGGEAALSNVADVKITTGVEDIAIDADDSNVEYFNLQGVKIQGQPAPGLYIRRQGKNATKVIIR